MTRKNLLAGLLVLAILFAATAGAVTILSVAGTNGSQPGGGVLTNATLANLYADLANIGTVIGPATGAPTGTGAMVLQTSPTLIAPALGTPSALVLTSATGTPTGAGVFLDTGTLSLTLTQLQTLNSVGYTILPAPGATSMYQMGGCALNLTRGSAAFTGGGTVSIGYGSSSSPATEGTIASTVFTTFAASHAVVVLPVAVAVTATTSLANAPIVMTAAGGDFASGTGATGQLDCQYRILTGIQ